jgi:hypothetical protein
MSMELDGDILTGKRLDIHTMLTSVHEGGCAYELRKQEGIPDAEALPQNAYLPIVNPQVNRSKVNG